MRWRARKIHFVCESIAPRKTLIRELSASNFQENNVLTARAVEAYVARIGKSDAWRAAVEGGANEADSFARCRAVLQKEVWWGDDYRWHAARLQTLCSLNCGTLHCDAIDGMSVAFIACTAARSVSSPDEGQ